MSDVIDTSVVKLGFDNREFVNNVNMSIMAVDALKDSLVFDSSSFDSLTKAANNIDLSGIAANVESLSARFSTFGIVGMTAIQEITRAAMELGSKLVGLLAKPWKQIVSGGWSRASNIGQAKFQLEGLFGKSEEGAAKLNMTMMATSEQVAQLAQQTQGFSEDMIVAMNAADYAVADTAYGLDSAAKAASVLATSGVDVVHFSEDLKDANGQMRTEMQVALRGISGVAAMANASYDEIAHVFERVSGNGRIMAIDLQSLSARGLNAAATLRDYLNEIGVTANATEKDIRDMVSKGEIDFMTFAKAMDSAYGDHAKDANNTFSGAFSNMKFALSKIGADFITPIRNRMVPLFNDIRIAINQVRKALNFKIKFPNLDEEISIVEMFTRVITNLTSKAHELFMMWNGGQNVMEQAMTGFANRSGQSLQRVKAVFDRVEKGSQSSASGIQELTDIARNTGVDLDEVYKSLSETFEKTDTEIREMCRNGEISFEDFYKAMSSVFGNDIQDTRISQLANLIHNITQGLWNLARTVSSIVGPVIYAFFQVFNVGGIKGIVGITEAFANFTSTLVASRETQEKIRSLAFNIFSILKSGISVVKKIASMIFKVAQALAPLVINVLEFADVIASVISYIVDIIVESDLLTSIITIVGKAFQVAGFIIVNVLRIIIGLLRPVIKAVGEVFAFLARSIGSIDVNFIGIIIDAIGRLADTIANGGIVQTITNAFQLIFGAIANAFKNFTLSFEVICDFLENVSDRIAYICDRIVTIFSNMKLRIVNVFNGLLNFMEWIADDPRRIISIVAQLTSLTILFRFAQTMRGIGRTFSGLGNVLNSNAISVFVSTIKTLARAVLEFSVAIVLLSSIPKANVETTIQLLWQLTAALVSLLVVYSGYMIAITAINNSVKSDPFLKFLNKVSQSINVFLRGIARAANIVAFGVALVGLAASIAILFNSVKKFAAMDYEEFEKGLVRIGYIVAMLASFITLLAVASGQHIGGKASITNSLVMGNGGLMGAAATLLALLVVLRAFKDIIIEYNNLGMSEEDFYSTLMEIGFVAGGMAVAISMMGAFVKQAGFGLMGSVSVMMAFLTVLESFISIIRLYAALFDGPDAIDVNTIGASLTMIAAIIIVIMLAISGMAIAMSEGSSKFKASLKGGLDFESNSAKFLGIVFTMLTLCLVLETVVGAMKLLGNDTAALQSADTLFGLLLIILGGLASITYFMKDVKAGSIFGLGTILIVLSTVLPLLSTFDLGKVVGSAVSLTIVIASLGYLMKSLNAFEPTFMQAVASVSILSVVLVELLFVIGLLASVGDASAIAASGFAIAATVAAFALAFKSIDWFTYNGGAIKQMTLMLVALTPFIILLSTISSYMNIDIPNLIVMILSISGLAVALSFSLSLLKGTSIGKGVFTNLIGMAVMLGALAFALVEASNILGNNIEQFMVITKFINFLIPIIALLAGLTMAMSSLGTRKDTALTMGIIVALVSGLVMAISAAAKFGDAKGTATILEGINDSIMGLIGLIGTIAVLSAVFGLISSTGIGAAGLLAGVGLMGLMLTVLAGFIGAITASATLGDADATVVLLSGLGTSLDAMVPFLLKMGTICTLFGAVSPLLVGGALGFGMLMTVISAFVGMIAFVATIGNPEDTVTLLLGLTKAMDRFNEFLGHFMIVLTLLGAVAPLAAVGALVFRTVLDILSQFAMSMAIIGVSGNVGNTITVMTSITDALKELVNSFLVLMVLGVMAIPVISGMLLISTAMGLLLGVSYIIGQIDAIRNSIISGITAILLSSEALVVATSTMGGIDLGALVKFIMALTIISAAPITGLTKFAMMATTMTVIGVSSAMVLKGSKTTLTMFKDLYATVELINAIVRANTKGLTDVTNDILHSAINLAAVSKYIGEWVPYSIAEGVISNSSLQTLATAGYLMAKVLEESIRDTMQIHSFSPLYGGIGGWAPESMGIGFINNLGSLFNAGSDGMADFGGMMNGLAGQYGTQAGASYAESMSETIWEFLEYAGQGYADLWNYFVGSGNDAVSLGLQSLGLADSDKVSALNNATSANNNYANSINNIDEAEKRYVNNNGTRPYFSPNLVVEEESVDSFTDDLNERLNEAMPDFGDLSQWLKPIEESFNLGSITEGLGDVGGAVGALDEDASSASKSVDELTNKIDKLMDKYEDLWDDAKERANKDLFKGVDDQGDDFLDSVKEIMDKFENIYKEAVEKTNGEDLFAEVKDEEEAFAPETLLKNLEDQVNQVNELNTIIGSLGGRIADNGLRAAISSMSVDDLPELRAMYRMDDRQLRSYEEMYRKKVQANQNKIQNELTGSLSQLTGEYTNVATYVATDASTNILVRNLQAQIDQLNEYNSTVASLTTRIKDVNLREAIAHMGVESLEELKALNSMTDAQLDEYTAMYNAKISQEAQVIKNELSTELSALLNEPVDISEFYMNYRGAINGVVGDVTEKAGEKGGSTIGTGMARGMGGSSVTTVASNSSKKITTAIADGLADENEVTKIEQNAQNIAEKIKNVLDPDKGVNNFKAIGGRIVFEIAKGMDAAREDATVLRQSISNIVTMISTEFTMRGASFQNIGRNIVSGIKIGIDNNSVLATSAAANLARNTILAYKNAVQVKSPSRVFMQIGRYLDEGLAIGLRDYSNLATDEATNMADGTISAVQNAIQQMSGMLDGTIDLNPVITPSLDLSEINARSAALANMFNGRQIAVQARADEQQAEMMTQLGNILADQNSEPKSITFNQTNNSPKALSRTEIYRQTRNAFSQLANAVQ